jgi:hypothetical protein
VSDVTFACGNCGQRIACDQSYVGERVTCPTCQSSVVVASANKVVPPPLPPNVSVQSTQTFSGTRSTMISNVGRPTILLQKSPKNSLLVIAASVCGIACMLQAVVLFVVGSAGEMKNNYGEPGLSYGIAISFQFFAALSIAFWTKFFDGNQASAIRITGVAVLLIFQSGISFMVMSASPEHKFDSWWITTGSWIGLVSGPFLYLPPLISSIVRQSKQPRMLDQKNHNTLKCVSCDEPIDPSAASCPKCGWAQPK